MNARVSEALLRDRCGPPQKSVVLLKFERNPKKFLEVLSMAEELAPYRTSLEAHGFSMILPSRAKVLVHPPHYQAVLEAVKQQGLTLYADHVIVEPELETVLLELLSRIVKLKRGGRAALKLRLPPGGDIANGDVEQSSSEDVEENITEFIGPAHQPTEVDGADGSASPATSILPVKKTFIHFSVPSSLYTPSLSSRARTT